MVIIRVCVWDAFSYNRDLSRMVFGHIASHFLSQKACSLSLIKTCSSIRNPEDFSCYIKYVNPRTKMVLCTLHPPRPLLKKWSDCLPASWKSHDSLYQKTWSVINPTLRLCKPRKPLLPDLARTVVTGINGNKDSCQFKYFKPKAAPCLPSNPILKKDAI